MPRPDRKENDGRRPPERSVAADAREVKGWVSW